MRFLALFFFTILVTSINAHSIKIGYINVDKVVNNLSQYQQENNALIQQFESKKQQLLDLFNHIELLKKNLDNNEVTFSNETYQKDLDKIRELEISFQTDTELWQQQLNQKKYESLQKIEAMINRAVEEFAISENYDLILYQNAAFASDQVNISNQIISKIEGTSP
jgi:outer membrane protein